VLKELVCLAIFIILSALFAAAMVIAGFVCQYKKKSAAKNSTYECGMQPIDDARIRFDVKPYSRIACRIHTAFIS
jgi:NADH-quinone oxidoreductase subunit A